MNNEIRKYLIDQCVKGRPIYYEDVAKQLKLDLSEIENRNQLSKVLGNISAYEHENSRPLISAIVIYKTKNDHGPGFYNLCEELGIGNATKLHKDFYGFTQLEKCKVFWQKPENYIAYYEIDSSVKEHPIDFFTTEEIDFLATWGGRVYDPENTEHVAAKNYIMKSIGNKVKYWSNYIAGHIPGMATFNWRMWSQKGWTDTPNGKVQVARFKKYSWARLFRNGDDKKDIFFTVEVTGDSKELVYKLDYYFESNSHLSHEQKQIVRKNIPDELRWCAIPVAQLSQYNWDSLLDESISFIAKNLHVYDKLIELAWGKTEPEELFTNFLRHQQAPNQGWATLPELNPSFSGVEKDYIKEAKENKELGEAGELLVKKHEEQRLRNLGFDDLAASVKIEKTDGKGYDVLSFDEKKNPKYIEVKTTTGKALTPFYYTINEKLFAEENRDNYFIYRLYNFDSETNTADFYIIEDIAEKLLLQETAFRAYIKKPTA